MNYFDFISRVKNKLSHISIETGLSALNKTSGSRIVMYHGIDLIGSKRFNGRFIGIEDFEKQIIYFKKYFNVVTLADYASGNYDKELFTIAITFDDGYQNNLKYALPILEKHKTPASFFITGLNEINETIIWSDFSDIAAHFLTNTILLSGMEFYKKNDGRLYSRDNELSLYDHIKKDSKGGYLLKKELQKAFLQKIDDFRKDSLLFDYWKLLSDNEIQKLSNSKYVTIGSHSYYHNNLGSLDHNEAMKEIILSKKYLENLIQKDITSIAFPDGSYTREIVDDSYKLGIQTQLAVNYLYEEDKNDTRIIDRFGIYPFYSANKLGHILANKKE